MRAGLERAAKLVPGTGFLEVTAGVAKPWQGGLDAFVRAELEWRPTERLTTGAFAQAGLEGVAAGIFGRIDL